MKVSIIVPVYNMQKHLAQCMASLFAQTLDSFEIICVDDGSTDDSLAMLQAYAQQDHRVRVFTQENQYAGVARNHGMEQAQGEYIGFVDPDDFIHPDMFLDLYNKAKETDSDLCVCGGQFYNDATGLYAPFRMIVPSLLPARDPFQASALGYNAFRFTTTGPVNKLLRRSFVEKHRLQFASVRIAEDLPFVCMAIALAERITAVQGKSYYNYRVSGDSSLGNTYRWPLSCAQAHTLLRESLEKAGVFSPYQAAFENLMAFEVERYARRYCETPEAFAQYHRWYQEEGKNIYNIHLSALDAGTLSNLLMTFDGVQAGMDSENVRRLVSANAAKYAALYQGHELERIRFVFGRLRKIEGTPRALLRVLGFGLARLTKGG